MKRIPVAGPPRTQKENDYAAEAAILSKAVGRPVKVVWSREDDIKFGFYHAVAAMYMKASLDEKGKPTAWLQRSVFPPISSTFALNTTYGDAGEMGPLAGLVQLVDEEIDQPAAARLADGPRLWIMTADDLGTQLGEGEQAGQNGIGPAFAHDLDRFVVGPDPE